MPTFVELVEVLLEATAHFHASLADLVLLQSFVELLEVKLATVVFIGCLGVREMAPLLER